MQITEEKINKELKSISFKMKDTDEELILKSELDILNKSTFGLLLILCGGVFITYLTIVKFLNNNNYQEISELIPLVIFGILGLLLSTAGILGIYSQNTDFIKINSSYIEFKSSSIKATKIKLSANLRIIKKSKVEYIQRSGTIGSAFRVIELHVDEEGNQNRMLHFHMDESEASKAHKLGDQLKSIISQKKNNYLQQGV